MIKTWKQFKTFFSNMEADTVDSTKPVWQIVLLVYGYTMATMLLIALLPAIIVANLIEEEIENEEQ
jgi:hypothetical protein